MANPAADPPSPSGDPAGIKPLDTLEDLQRFGIDGANRLYWNSRPVEIRRTLDLSPAQKIGAVIVAAGAVLGGLGAAATGVKDAADFLCTRHLAPQACPVPDRK